MDERTPLLDALMRLVIGAIIFFDLSSEDIVDSRSAVKMLEYTAYELNKLSLEDRDLFLSYARQMAEEDYRPHVRSLLLSLDTALFSSEEDET